MSQAPAAPPLHRSWYVLQVAPGREFEIAHQLTVRGHEPLIPHSADRSKDKKDGTRGFRRSRRVPLFPKYVFVGIAGTPQWADVKAIEPRPVMPVQFDDTGPAKLSSRDVEFLRNVKDAPRRADIVKALQAGDLARIAAGALMGISSVVSKIRGEYAELAPVGPLGKMRVPLNQLEAA